MIVEQSIGQSGAPPPCPPPPALCEELSPPLPPSPPAPVASAPPHPSARSAAIVEAAKDLIREPAVADGVRHHEVVDVPLRLAVDEAGRVDVVADADLHRRVLVRRDVVTDVRPQHVGGGGGALLPD